jgi:hypothetical protein
VVERETTSPRVHQGEKGDVAVHKVVAHSHTCAESDLVCELHLSFLFTISHQATTGTIIQADASHRVFAIPELVVLIAKYLSSHDINQWMVTGAPTRAHPLEPL